MNASLYHRFLKWKLKWENILAMLPGSKKCKKVKHGVKILEWINMFPGACPQKIFAWIVYGPSMKIFASHKEMKSEPDLTCLQASDKAIILKMSGTMLYKPKCVLPNTHQKLQVSCTEIYSGPLSKMKILFPKPSMNAVLIHRSSLQAKSDSLQRKWRYQRLPLVI